MTKWAKIDEDSENAEDQIGFIRSVFLTNFKSKRHFELHEFVDWDGNVKRTQGDERLKPLMDMTTNIESKLSEMEEKDLIQSAAPILHPLLEELTGEKININELSDVVSVTTGGNWQGFKRGPKESKYKRLQ